jgi:hypothetical protein
VFEIRWKITEKIDMNKTSKFIIFSLFFLISFSVFSSETKLMCDVKSQSSSSDWSGDPKFGQVTLTIYDTNKGVSITLNGDPSFTVGAMGFSTDKFEGINLSSKNRYHLETKEKFGRNSTILDLDRVSGFVDVYSLVYSGVEMVTWRITGKCKLMNQQKMF